MIDVIQCEVMCVKISKRGRGLAELCLVMACRQYVNRLMTSALLTLYKSKHSLSINNSRRRAMNMKKKTYGNPVCMHVISYILKW